MPDLQRQHSRASPEAGDNDEAAANRVAPTDTISRQSAMLLATLPIDYYPYITARRYPHVLNGLAEVWDEPTEFALRARAFLLKSARPRRGFPAGVFIEILQLVVFHGSVATLALFEQPFNLDDE
jgi:hypothetical protein